MAAVQPRQSDSGIELSEQDRENIRDGLSQTLDHKQIIYAITLSTFTAVLLFTMVIVLFFYLLDSLLSERKDRSILFWKSLPVSDTEVVLSKLLTAAVVVPLFVLVVSSALQILFALIWSVRFNGTFLGDALMAWDGPTWLKLQASFLLVIVTAILWYLPLIAYLMVVSVWARRNAFLWAVLPPVAILAIEGMILGSNRFGEFLGHRLIGVFELLEQQDRQRPRQRHADGARRARRSFRGTHQSRDLARSARGGRDDLWRPSASAATATTADPSMRAARGLHFGPPCI